MSAIRTLASTEKPLFSQASPEGVRLVFYQEKVPDPFWAHGKRDRQHLADCMGETPGPGG